jgi:hypothetical protein
MIITRRTQCAWLYLEEVFFFVSSCLRVLRGPTTPLITQVHLKAVSAANASSCDLDAL